MSHRGFEPRTHALKGRCATVALVAHKGAPWGGVGAPISIFVSIIPNRNFESRGGEGSHTYDLFIF